MRNVLECLAVVALLSPAVAPQSAPHAKAAARLRLDPSTKLTVKNGRVLWLDYRGRRALKLAPSQGHERDTDQEMVAVLAESDFKDGVIEVDVAGARRQRQSTRAGDARPRLHLRR